MVNHQSRQQNVGNELWAGEVVLGGAIMAERRAKVKVEGEC